MVLSGATAGRTLSPSLPGTILLFSGQLDAILLTWYSHKSYSCPWDLFEKTFCCLLSLVQGIATSSHRWPHMIDRKYLQNLKTIMAKQLHSCLQNTIPVISEYFLPHTRAFLLCMRKNNRGEQLSAYNSNTTLSLPTADSLSSFIISVAFLDVSCSYKNRSDFFQLFIMKMLKYTEKDKE